MSETLRTVDVDQTFEDIVEAERQAARETFQENVEAIDAATTPEAEAGLDKITMGKKTGVQDTGGGGFEWEKRG